MLCCVISHALSVLFPLGAEADGLVGWGTSCARGYMIVVYAIGLPIIKQAAELPLKCFVEMVD